ncbi:MAG: barstar family protein [Butyrivibrio sp.]|nr:barstar family protein [Butyrivibrio sp.]
MRKVFYIDLKDVIDKEKLHEVLIRDLPLPDYYGKNLDAFYDVLTEMGDDWDLIFYNCTAFKEKEPDYYRKLRKVLEQAQEECDNFRARLFP